MLGTILYGSRDVRCEEVPEPKLLKPTDAIIRLSASASAAPIFGPSVA
jgi:hypothetical protein